MTRAIDLGPTQIVLSLRGRWQASLFLLTVGFLSLLLAAGTSLAGYVLSFDTPSQGLWLLRADAEDPQLHYGLGRSYFESDQAQAVRYMRRAAELSPDSRNYWSHLAKTCGRLGDIKCADEAWSHLLELCPMVPLYHWHAVAADLRSNRLDDAVAQSITLLRLDPGYSAATWTSLQGTFGPDPIFEKVADFSSPAVKVGYVDFLSSEGEDDAAYRIWKRAVVSLGSIPFSSVRPYLERLIDRGRIVDAAGVWHDLRRLGVVRGDDAGTDGKAVFNGSFEQFPLNTGFDWRWADNLSYMAIDFSAPAAYRGAHCLRIDFTVSRNQEYEPVYQIVPVQANHTYSLTAYVRSEGITSDTGPVLRVSDTQQPSFRDVLTETTVGTTTWHEVHAYFSTRPATQAVRLSVWRPLGRVFPTDISGSFWLDAVSIQMVDPAAGARGLKQELEPKD